MLGFGKKREPAVVIDRGATIMVPMYLDDVYAIERGVAWTFGEDRVQAQLKDLLRRFKITMTMPYLSPTPWKLEFDEMVGAWSIQDRDGDQVGFVWTKDDADEIVNLENSRR